MKLANTKIVLRQSGIVGAPGQRIEGIFEVVLDLDAIQEHMRKAARNKSRESRDGAVVVIYTASTKDHADRYCMTGKLVSDPAPDPALAKRKAAGDLVGKLVRWAHQQPETPEGTFRVLSATYDGMITIEGYAGQFAPHLFVIAGV